MWALKPQMRGRRKKVKSSGNNHGHLKEKKECQLHLNPFTKKNIYLA